MEGHRTEGFHSICSSEDSQQCQEEIDDIQIQRHWSPNVVVIGVTLNQVVCVVHDVPTEYDCSQKPIDHNRDLTQGKEYLEVDKARIDKSNPNKKNGGKIGRRDRGQKIDKGKYGYSRTWMTEKRISTKIAPDKKGPRKPKSWPLLAAQNVYKVRLITTPAVRIAASKITFPAAKWNYTVFWISDNQHRQWKTVITITSIKSFNWWKTSILDSAKDEILTIKTLSKNQEPKTTVNC